MFEKMAVVTVAAVLAAGLFACESGAGSQSYVRDSDEETAKSAQTKEAASKKEGDDTMKEFELDDVPEVGSRLELSEEEWKERLTEEEFHILREAGTEPAGSGELLHNKKDGVYVCAGCGAPLFSSETKFKSGTGWPSFYTPYEDGRVSEREDNSLGMTRTEVVCARCDGHLGHVFNDGPPPTGKRYCINSLALDFREVKEGKKKAGK